VAFNRVLLVEPETVFRLQMRNAVDTMAVIDAETGVPTARQRLLGAQYHWLVTNIRLQAYNGLHLAYLARMSTRPIRILVYGEDDDLLLAREAQELGAFYESRKSVASSLAGYLTSLLPATDRRNAAVQDRRSMYRGGRRSGDVAVFSDPLGVRQSSGSPRLPR
jgi:DNA-binding NarL/FixJ family response regulator